MTEHVRQKHLLTHDRIPHAWTVTFDLNDVSPDGKREDLARNMVANVAVGDEVVRNDFDRVSIFQRPIFNATWDSTAKRWVDLVAKGEEGFTFSPTEKNREVVYRCQPFWYKLGFEGGYGPNTVSVSDRPLEGYKLAPMFRDGQTVEYRPCFEMALGSDGLPHSRAGLMPYEGTPTELMEKVFSYDSASCAETMADWFSDYLLLEFATRNLQGIMRGVTRGAMDTTIYWDQEGEPDLGIYTHTPDAFEEGESYLFVYMEDEERIAREVELLCIEETEYDEVGYRLYFDIEDDAEFALEHHDASVYEMPKSTGEALLRVRSASSGRANADPYSACVWRGKENPWGNFSSFMSDVLFEATGKVGTYVPYTLEDLRQFDGTINAAYTQRSYQPKNTLRSSKAYIVSFTASEPDYFLIPAEYKISSPEYYYATSMLFMPNNYSKGVRYLRVGGDYTESGSINHATYEVVEDRADYVKFGGRLVLREGLR